MIRHVRRPGQLGDGLETRIRRSPGDRVRSANGVKKGERNRGASAPRGRRAPLVDGRARVLCARDVIPRRLPRSLPYAPIVQVVVSLRGRVEAVVLGETRGPLVDQGLGRPVSLLPPVV